jgi:plasmid stabilization system protein ParE
VNGKQLRIRSEAREEIDSAFEWYYQRSPEAAGGFLAEVTTSLAQIVSHPQLYPALYGHYRILTGFPYSIIFQEKEEMILIIAVAHAKRRFGYWRRRI